MAERAAFPKVAREVESALTCSRPSGPFAAYSASVERITMARAISFGDTAELDRTIRDQVDEIFDIVVDLVEELVKGNEAWAFDVPVRLFALGLQVDRVGETPVERIDHLDANLLGEIVLRRIHRARLIRNGISTHCTLIDG